MQFLFRLFISLISSSLEKLVNKLGWQPPKRVPLNPIPDSFNWAPEVVRPDFLGLVQFIKDKSETDSHYRIVKNNVLEYGLSPQRFILVSGEGDDELYYMSFFAACDPMFSAIMFVLVRDYYQNKVLLSDSFLSRLDGSLALGSDADFAAVYTMYYQALTSVSNPVSLGSQTEKKKFDIN